MSYELRARKLGHHRHHVIYKDRDQKKVLKVQQYFQQAFPDMSFTVMSAAPKKTKTGR